MAITREFADALHVIVEHLPVREEQTSLDLKNAIEAEVEVPDVEPAPGYGETPASSVASDE